MMTNFFFGGGRSGSVRCIFRVYVSDLGLHNQHGPVGLVGAGWSAFCCLGALLPRSVPIEHMHSLFRTPYTLPIRQGGNSLTRRSLNSEPIAARKRFYFILLRLDASGPNVCGWDDSTQYSVHASHPATISAQVTTQLILHACLPLLPMDSRRA